jgi:hypothetical protein
VLRDYNNNGSFDCELPLNECEAYGKYIHLKEKLYTWQIAPDLNSFSVTPVDETLPTGFYESAHSADKRTQVALKTGYETPTATTGTINGDGKWQLITLDGNTPKIQLPAGDYILSQFALRSQDADRQIAHFPLSSFTTRESVSFSIPKEGSFQAAWGEPIKLTLDAYHPNDSTLGSTVQIYINVVGTKAKRIRISPFISPKPAAWSRSRDRELKYFAKVNPLAHTNLLKIPRVVVQVPAELKGKKVTLVPFFEECPVSPVPLKFSFPAREEEERSHGKKSPFRSKS